MEPIPSDPARLTVDSRCAHGEGVLWCERRQALLWVDIDGARLWMHLPVQGTSRSWPLPDRPGCIGLGQAGDLLLVLAESGELVLVEASPERPNHVLGRFQALEGRMPAATGTPIGGAWPKPIAAQSSCSRGSNPSFIPIAMK